MVGSTKNVSNYVQQAAAELSVGIGHIEACLHLWSPATGLTPAEEKTSEEVMRWERLHVMFDELKKFHADEGPGA